MSGGRGRVKGYLYGEMTAEPREQRLDEAAGPRFYLRHGHMVRDRRYHADKGRVGPVVPNGIQDRVDLPPVFTRDNSTMALVPVKHQLAIEALADDHAVHFDRRRAGGAGNSVDRNCGPAYFERLPARASFE